VVTVTENLVKVALNTVQTKCAAQHYETNISCHISTGSDMGNIGHGRKQFVDILRASEIWLDSKAAKFLSTPLVSTSLPPHFYVSADKSTVHRVTNQAIVVCPMIAGKRQAIPVQAPCVYELEDIDNGITEATADKLADNVYETITSTYSVGKDTVAQSWQGTVCDGQYQAGMFEERLNELREKNDPVFDRVIWDPPHSVNLAAEDVLSGRSSEFFSRLVSRSSRIHQMFNRGKMLALAKSQAVQSQCQRLLVTSRTCSTRFFTSQYHEFEKLMTSLPVYIETFRENKYNEIKEYEIAGEDFVIDMCGTLDVMRPAIEMLVKLQDLQVPIWKICVWSSKVVRELGQVATLSLDNPAAEQFSYLHGNMKDIRKGKYKGVKLVPGWLLVGTETDENQETVYRWVAREQEDCEKDLKQLAVDLAESLNSRYKQSVTQLQEYLTSLDLDCLFQHLCGERLFNCPGIYNKLDYICF
jgi:hypothetical protein